MNGNNSVNKMNSRMDNKMNSMIITIFVVIVLAACSSFGTIVKETVDIDQKVNSGEVRENVMKGNLSLTQEDQITHAGKVYMDFREKYSVIFHNPTNIEELATANLVKDYASLQYQYDVVYNIVRSQWSSYDDETKRKLLEYQNDARNLDEAVIKAIVKNDKLKVVKEVLSALLF